jgi:hypothetical protein
MFLPWYIFHEFLLTVISNGFLPQPWYPLGSYLYRDIQRFPAFTVLFNSFLLIPWHPTVSCLYRDIQRFPASAVTFNGFLLLPYQMVTSKGSGRGFVFRFRGFQAALSKGWGVIMNSWSFREYKNKHRHQIFRLPWIFTYTAICISLLLMKKYPDVETRTCVLPECIFNNSKIIDS